MGWINEVTTLKVREAAGVTDGREGEGNSGVEVNIIKRKRRGGQLGFVWENGSFWFSGMMS